MWIVLQLLRSPKVTVWGQELPLVLLPEMAGLLPVFMTKADAEKYAGKQYKILEIEEKPQEGQG